MIASFVFSALLTASISLAGAGSCPSDVDGDGVVGTSDLLQVLAEWACQGCPSDVNGDGVTGTADLLQVLADWGCEADAGPVTTLSGTVTNTLTGAGIAGATVTVGGEVAVTDQSGDYVGEFPIGLHDAEIAAEHFSPFTQQIVLFPDIPATLDASLDPVAAVVVEIDAPPEGDPGEAIEAFAEVTILDGSTLVSYAWAQTAGPDAIAGPTDTDMVTLSLGSMGEYKANLIHVLEEPPITADELPPNVPLPEGEFPAGLQNRFEVVAVNPFALDEAGVVALALDVTTTSGMYSAEDEVHSALPWSVTTGLRNVPIDTRVLLHGKDQASYAWQLTPPAGSTAALIDGSTRNPEFTPDVPGVYQVTVNDEAGGGNATLHIYAGNWRGVIVGQDAEGRPIASSTCTGCHTNLGFDMFTPWSQTGHAEIFSDLLDTSTHYGESCFKCHSVGFDPGSSNNGFDDAPDYQAFLDAGLLNNPGDNWTTMLDAFPFAAQQANIQCENCHGPQWGMLGVGSAAHGPVQPVGEPRVTLAAGLCASCHGEPLRHARYQQWQLSAHANYEVAIDEGTSGSCSRCHTANGFLTWLPVLLGEVPGDPLDDVTVTWTADEVHPQTCVTCHDPHSAGNVSGINNNATVRITDNTPPLIAGFTAFAVGRGAICMTCHNSRRGLHNDSVFDDFYGTSEATRAPHGSAQADLLMGENAYLVPVGIRGNHSFLQDTCVQCHMVQTPPPDQLSYNQGGTNHTFYASRDICAECHNGFDADTIQNGVQGTLDILQTAIEMAMLDYIGERTAMGNIIDLDGLAQIDDVADVAGIDFSESRGRQAMTVTFTGGMAVGPVTVNNVDILDSNMNLLGALYDFADPALIKSGWNWTLVNNDGSLGVHNPSYAYLILTTSIGSLNPGLGAGLEWPWWAQGDPPEWMED